MWWVPSKKGKFSVCSFCRSIIDQENNFVPGKNIWKTKASQKVAFYVWTASLGKILTMDKLQKRCIVVIDWCCTCRKSVKTFASSL